MTGEAGGVAATCGIAAGAIGTGTREAAGAQVAGRAVLCVAAGALAGVEGEGSSVGAAVVVSVSGVCWLAVKAGATGR